MKKVFLFIFIALAKITLAQTLGKLTVEKIMRDPKWMGVSPDNIRWSENSKKVYFTWNPENLDRNALYSISVTHSIPTKVEGAERITMPSEAGTLNKKLTQELYERNGDIFLLDISLGKSRQLTNTVEQESNPMFTLDEKSILFVRANNVFSFGLNNGELRQLTNFINGPKAASKNLSQQDKWLKQQQASLFEIIQTKSRNEKADSIERKFSSAKRPKEIQLEDKLLRSLQASPNGRYITYTLVKQADGAKITIVPNYVSTTGFTEDIVNRTKVGSPQASYESFIYDTLRDSVYLISPKDIPGIKDIPDFFKDYPKQLDAAKKLNADRKIIINSPLWNETGTEAVVVAGAQDNKDRWILKLDAQTGKLTSLDRQHDDAWIGGPGINGTFGGGTLGWIDQNHIYFQSEASGYSHLYSLDLNSGIKKQLTAGKWEVQSIKLSNDKKSFYFSANIEHPGITHFYRIPVSGGSPVKLTSLKGGNEVSLSPDEKWLAIRYSYSNKPWELYVQENKAGANAKQITHSTTAEFNSYSWREPQVISFKNRYGDDVYARLYQPQKANSFKPAVVFVHGAGYLQNVHYWWSQYFREYMFNNLLVENGYTVLDVDYTASSGYGRNHRTGIYRHMGGKDLTDQVDGVKLLVEKYGVNPKNVGLYGGSYGGFITLMALFTQQDVFASGAGLRSVTDWAHYNHGYTSNILNEPFTDEIAYQQSSPINFAAGLKGNLLMCHGMVDQNVNFQDIVRLSQKLIELHKEKWELAVYPVEDHGFVQPSSWTDEYKRIFNLFETTLKK